MATNILELGTAPANADRVFDRIINRPAFEQLETGSLAVEYAFTLCHAIMDRLETLQGLHGPNGVHANGNTKGHLDIALNLCSLQLDKLIEGKEGLSEGERGWPMLDGHRL
jgi:hypothetical protein